MRKLQTKRLNKTLMVSADLHSKLEKARAELGLRDFTQLLNYLLGIAKK